MPPKKDSKPPANKEKPVKDHAPAGEDDDEDDDDEEDFDEEDDDDDLDDEDDEDGEGEDDDEDGHVGGPGGDDDDDDDDDDLDEDDDEDGEDDSEGEPTPKKGKAPAPKVSPVKATKPTPKSDKKRKVDAGEESTKKQKVAASNGGSDSDDEDSSVDEMSVDESEDEATPAKRKQPKKVTTPKTAEVKTEASKDSAKKKIKDEKPKELGPLPDPLPLEADRVRQEWNRCLYITGPFPKGITSEEVMTLSSDMVGVTFPKPKFHFRKKQEYKGGVANCIAKFKTEAVADKNLKSMQGKKLGEVQIKVDYEGEKSSSYVARMHRVIEGLQNVDKTKLFLSFLPTAITETDLKKHFPNARKIDVIKPRVGDNRIAFVQFDNTDLAAAAFEASGNLTIEGRKINVMYCFKKPQPKKKKDQKKQQQTATPTNKAAKKLQAKLNRKEKQKQNKKEAKAENKADDSGDSDNAQDDDDDAMSSSDAEDHGPKQNQKGKQPGGAPAGGSPGKKQKFGQFWNEMKGGKINQAGEQKQPSNKQSAGKWNNNKRQSSGSEGETPTKKGKFNQKNGKGNTSNSGNKSRNSTPRGGKQQQTKFGGKKTPLLEKAKNKKGLFAIGADSD